MSFLTTQWRNANDKGNYPFSNAASMTNGDLIIPNTLFTDARFYPIGVTPPLYLSSVIKTDSKVTLNLSTEGVTDIASASYDIVSPPLRLRFTDKFGREAGIAVTDASRLSPLSGWPSGTHKFSSSESNFVGVVVTPVPDSGVMSIQDEDSALTGDVYLVGGSGVTLTADITDPAKPVIEVHLDGEPLFRQSLCSEIGFTVPCFLQTINGILPDDFGDFYLGACGIDSSNTVIRITPTTTGLRIHTVGRTGGR